MQEALWGSGPATTCLQKVRDEAKAAEEDKVQKHSIPFVKMDVRESLVYN